MHGRNFLSTTKPDPFDVSPDANQSMSISRAGFVNGRVPSTTGTWFDVGPSLGGATVSVGRTEEEHWIALCVASDGQSAIKGEPLASLRFRALPPVQTRDNVVQALPSRDCSQSYFNACQPCRGARSSFAPWRGASGDSCPGQVPTSRCTC